MANDADEPAYASPPCFMHELDRAFQQRDRRLPTRM